MNLLLALKDSGPPSTEQLHLERDKSVVTEEVDIYEKLGRNPVQASPDFHRIMALPRRTLNIPTGPTELELALKKPGSTVSLFPIQAAALEEARRAGGLFAPIGVGHGKTLVTLLLPTVLASKVSVLFIPPTMRSQLLEHDIPFWRQHFHLPNIAGEKQVILNRPLLYIIPYSQFSRANFTDILEKICPDLIIADEAHCLKSMSAARTKRFSRYFQKRPQTRFCALSGTMTAKSLRDYAHLAKCALKASSPAPIHFGTVLEWSGALDPGQHFANPPGVLNQLCKPGEDLRDGFRRRIIETAGVVATEEGSVGSSLIITRRDPGEIPTTVLDTMATVRAKEERPDGEVLVEATDLWRCMQTLAYGFYYRWIYPHGEPRELIDEWFSRRREWNKELRAKLKLNREHLDSPLLCIQAIHRAKDGYKGPLPVWHAHTWDDWAEIKDQVQPETQAVWLSEYLAKDAANWLSEETGILWYEHAAFGQKVAELSRSPMYGPGAQASADIIKESGERSVIASIRAHGTGKNLQMFNKNLVANVPGSGSKWEQLIGRTHRAGQTSDEILAVIYMHTEEVAEAFWKAVAYAEYIQGTFGGKQKLCYATKLFDFPEREKQLAGGLLTELLKEEETENGHE